MTAIFVDTNVFVYFRDASEPEKQASAASWLNALWLARAGRTSFQVLNEYYVTVTQRLKPGLDRKSARADVRNLMAWQPTNLDRAVIERAWGIQDRYGFSWWDTLIISAAQKADCSYLLTEDLQHEQRIDGVTLVNPFIRLPDEVLQRS